MSSTVEVRASGEAMSVTRQPPSGVPRVLFVGRSLAHLPYYETVLKSLLDRGAAVRALFDREWSRKAGSDKDAFQRFRERFAGAEVAWLVRRSDRWRDRVFDLRELRSYRSYLIRRDTTPFYVDRWRSYLNESTRGRVDSASRRAALRTPAADWAMRLYEASIPPDSGISNLLRTDRPEIVYFCPLNQRFSEETDYLKAARRLGIPTAMSVYSWDNLTTKGLIQLPVDTVFAWNEAQRVEAMTIHRVPARKIVVAGSPFFDKWFDRTDIESREAFAARAGLDSRRKIILYLGSSANIARDESWFVAAILKRLRASSDPSVTDAQILLRPHPANANVFEHLEGVVRWPKEGALPDTPQQLADLRATFRHSAAAIGINTSGMVDAVLAGVPTFSVMLERYADTQGNSAHFAQLAGAGAIEIASDLDALEEGLIALFSGRDNRAARRRDFAIAFARPCGLDRTAGDIIAQGLIERALGRQR